jgi:hypothetical protein
VQQLPNWESEDCLLRLLPAVLAEEAAVMKSWPITPISKNYPYYGGVLASQQKLLSLD